jgi:hypothetical protein
MVFYALASLSGASAYLASSANGAPYTRPGSWTSLGLAITFGLGFTLIQGLHPSQTRDFSVSRSEKKSMPRLP